MFVRSLALCIIWLTGCSVAAWAHDAREELTCKPLPILLEIDQAWGGTRVAFGTLESNEFIYTGYYDAHRWLTVSQVNKCTGVIRKIRLPSRFAGWDAHNTVALALDSAGRLHLAGNMHVSPLVYARMVQADNLASLAVLRPMVGQEEDRTTYPIFFRFPDGALGFSYRSGISGNGKEIVNRFDGESWTRWIDKPLFAQANTKQHVNAYHTGFIRGPDGLFHIAWVWRENYKVETNFNVNYAKSQDLKTWKKSTGEDISLPITPKNAEVVAVVPQQGGLFNNVQLGFDTQGRVVVSFLKFDSVGFSQLFHSRREAAEWKTVKSTDWTYRWDPRGGGTIPSKISFSGVAARNGSLLEHVRHPSFGTGTLKYDEGTLLVESVIKNYEWEPSLKVKRTAPVGAVVNVLPARNPDGRTGRNHAISWLSHPADNRDKPRECQRVGLPCNFVSELLLHSQVSVSVLHDSP